jgi:hypothetical protein
MREKRELEQKLEGFKDIDANKYRDLLAKETKLNEGKLYDQNKIDELVNGRTEAMRREHDNQIKTLTTRSETAEKERDTLRDNLKRQVIDRTVIDAGSKFGLLPEAHGDIVRRAREVADLDENGKLIFKNPDGTKMYGKDGVTLLGAEEWAEKQATVDGKFMFKPSQGSGTPPGGGGGGPRGGGSTVEIDNRVYGLGQGQYNPFKAPVNLTDQGKVIDRNYELAVQLAGAVGKKLPPKDEAQRPSISASAAIA